VFTYSERPNTAAIEMEGVVPLHERKQRNSMLRTLSEKKKRAFYEQHKYYHTPCIFEAEQSGEYMHGFSDNYIKVKAPFNAEWTNTIINIPLQEINPDGEMLLREFSENYTIIA
jgi:threonylcarbamoyladenosine tRNA methylthiotransferase MtaB